MTIFIKTHHDKILVNQLRVGRLDTTRWDTDEWSRPGAEFLEIHGPFPETTIMEVSGDDQICAEFTKIVGEDVQMSAVPNVGLTPDLTIVDVRCAKFYYWRGVQVGSDRDFGLFWDGGPIQLQWLREHGCSNPTPPEEIIAEMLRRALASELDFELPEWWGWYGWPPVRGESSDPYVALVRIIGEPDKPYTVSRDPIKYMSLIRRGDTNEIACAGFDDGEGIKLAPLTIMEPQLDGSNLEGLFFQGDSLEDLTYDKWKKLFEDFPAVVYVGRSGRSWIETATVVDDQLVLNSQEVLLLVPSQDESDDDESPWSGPQEY